VDVPVEPSRVNCLYVKIDRLFPRNQLITPSQNYSFEENYRDEISGRKIIPHFIVSSLANVSGYFLDRLLSPILPQYSFTHLPPTKTTPSQKHQKKFLYQEKIIQPHKIMKTCKCSTLSPTNALDIRDSACTTYSIEQHKLPTNTR
jgi:hypothetical protein